MRSGYIPQRHSALLPQQVEALSTVMMKRWGGGDLVVVWVVS
jgi:hypothetical protein